jgi:RimJ/RimL family protein N-acetyltransferase
VSGARGVPQTARLRIRTPRLLLRSWRAADAAACKEAIDSSLEQLKPWIPWAHAEPSTLEVVEARLAAFEHDFAAGRDWRYGCFTADERVTLGGAGLHPRQGPGILEVGYWLRPTATGLGYATEAAAALTRCAVERHAIEKVEIRCDPENRASVRIPERLGFRLRERLAANALTHDGRPRDTLVWELRANEVTPDWAQAYPVAYEEEEPE